MISDLSHLGPWRAGESRYVPCQRHAGALDRMDFEDAWERARSCPNCLADFEGRPA